MDAKAEKKLAKKKARQEMLNKIRQDTLVREMAMDEATLMKIKNKWFDSVIETKVPQMQDNLKHILHYMEKLIEAENFRQLLYETERQELEEKSTLLAQGHGNAMETLFDIYEKRIEDMHNVYSEMAQTKKHQADEEFSKIEEREQVIHENLETMLLQMEEDAKKEEDMMNCGMFFKLDDERSKNTEIMEDLRGKLENKMEKRWGEISAALSNYEQSTKERRKEYNMLKTKDDADCKIIHQQMKKTQKLFEQLEDLKKCMDECYAPKETITLIKDTSEERTKFLNTFKKLKHIFGEEIRLDEMNMKILTGITSAILTTMGEVCTKGERILTMYRICQRLETEQEKVLPVGDTGLPAVAMETRKKKNVKEPEKEDSVSENLGSGLSKDVEILEKFWKKVGKVRLSKIALMKCIKNMRKENKILRQILSSYMHEVSEKK